jgi:penicillin V acylase-like amidase (Ntn superfamily)
MKKLLTTILASIITLSTVSIGLACSELNHRFNGLGMFTARTMDVFKDLTPSLAVYPRGIKENGNTKVNPLKWTNKYGYASIDESNLENLTAEGVNEKGLTAHLLYLGQSVQADRDIDKKGVNGLIWVRYVLGNFSTVQEVLDNLHEYQIFTESKEVDGKEVYIPVHFAIEDAKGNSALIEYVNKKLVVHKGYNAITNEPDYDTQLKGLKYAKKHADKIYNINNLAGGARSENRFIRANFISENLPVASNLDEAVNYMFAAANSVAVPFIAGYRDESLDSPTVQDKWPTQWKSVTDLSNHVPYITDTLIGNRVYVALDDVNLAIGQPIKSISIMNKSLVGDISNKLIKK